MALRNIFVKGDDILRKTAREVKEVTERITILLDETELELQHHRWVSQEEYVLQLQVPRDILS